MQNLRLFLTLATFISLSAASAVLAQEQGGKAKAPETELGQTMEQLNGAWRKLRRQAADPASNASSLELVAIIKAGGEKALTLQPARVEDVPAADREKFVQDYRNGLQGFLAQVGKLEEALQAGDNPAAVELIQKIGALQKEAHKEFKRPDK
jgi:soluble cytochrome b562